MEYKEINPFSGNFVSLKFILMLTWVVNGLEYDMVSKRCSRCNRVVLEGDLFYQLDIKVLSGFDGTIKLDGPYDVNSEINKLKAYPEDLIEEEVYKEFHFILCPRCKEIYCSNPLHLRLDGEIPDHIPPLEEK